MSFKTEKKGNYALITLEVEKLDGIVSPSLKSELVMADADGFSNVIIDMSAARYCDSSGLSAILVGNRLCKNAGGSFIICGLQDSVMKLIQISQLDSILTITPTVLEAEKIMLDNEQEAQRAGEENN